MAQGSLEFFQSAWVVTDIEAGMRHWLGQGVGPFFTFARANVTRYHHRGKPSDFAFAVAIAQAGPMQVELIQPLNGSPSHIRDTFEPGQSGFHHICRFTQDFDAEIASFDRQGVVLAGNGVSGDMRFGYWDTRATLGCMTEIIEDKASIRDFFATIAEAGRTWDGTDPIRRL